MKSAIKMIIIICLAASAPGAEERKTAEIQEPTGNLRLEQALALAMMHNPELQAFSHEVRAAEARVLNARAIPNPNIKFEVEEYDRNGEGFDSTESSIVLGQVIELGRKRALRTRIAELQGSLAGWDFESKRLHVTAETGRLFMAVITADKQLKIARAAVELAQKTQRAAASRVEAGKEPPLQKAKAAAELELVRIKEDEAASNLDLAKRKLSAMWGSDAPLFDSAKGNIDRILTSIPALAELKPKLSENPRLARWETELDLRKASLDAAKAERIPNLNTMVGVQSYEEDGSDALKFEVRVPLPLFNRNSGNINAAESELEAARQKAKAARTALAAELAEAYSNLLTAHKKVRALRNKVIPTMEDAYNAAEEGYSQGKFDFLDMLDAQRSLFKTKSHSLDALLEYHSEIAKIQLLTGTSINELSTNKTKEDK